MDAHILEADAASDQVPETETVSPPLGTFQAGNLLEEETLVFELCCSSFYQWPWSLS